MITLQHKLQIMLKPFLTTKDVQILISENENIASYQSAHRIMKKFVEHCKLHNIEYTTPLKDKKNILYITDEFLKYAKIDKKAFAKNVELLNKSTTKKEIDHAQKH